MKDKPFAITLDVGSSLANKTGSWRTERPVYLDLLPPCNNACPAGENVQAWLFHAEEGRYEDAWRQLMLDNPFPAIMGRVCYRPCESVCNRGQLDESVGINSVERFLGDEAIRRRWTVRVTAPQSGKRVLVVGAGPSGLAAAYHLTLLGHAVTIRDSGDRPGGMMRYGIPAYRLPRDVLDAEVNRILAMGVLLETGRTVTDVVAAMHDDGFDAVFLAVGAHIGRRADIPAGDSARILDAVSVLRGMEGGERPLLGRRVVVYGGETPPWTPPAPPAGSAPPTPSSSTAAPATACPPTTSRSRRHSPRACGCAGCPPSPGPTPAWSRWRRCAWTRPDSRNPPASSKNSARTRWCSPSASRPTCRCWAESPTSSATAPTPAPCG
jgi:hypothetical protein